MSNFPSADPVARTKAPATLRHARGSRRGVVSCLITVGVRIQRADSYSEFVVINGVEVSPEVSRTMLEIVNQLVQEHEAPEACDDPGVVDDVGL